MASIRRNILYVAKIYILGILFFLFLMFFVLYGDMRNYVMQSNVEEFNETLGNNRQFVYKDVKNTKDGGDFMSEHVKTLLKNRKVNKIKDVLVQLERFPDAANLGPENSQESQSEETMDYNFTESEESDYPVEVNYTEKYIPSEGNEENKIEVEDNDSYGFIVGEKKNVSIAYKPIKFEDLPTAFKQDGFAPYVEILKEDHPPYLPNYKNPCWLETLPEHERKVQLKCMAYFYVVGNPKCGTTDLFYTLNRHPLLAHTHLKEIQWWSRSRFIVKREKPYSDSFRSYTNYFKSPARDVEKYSINDPVHGNNYHPTIIGDGTPSLLWWNKHWMYYPENKDVPLQEGPRYIQAHFIKHIIPESRIIVTLRNPTNRLYSWYLFRSQRDKTVFHDLAKSAADKFNDCLVQSTLWSCANNYSLQDTGLFRLRVSLYYPFIAKWLEVYPRERMYVNKLEEYKENKIKILNEIYDMLDVGHLSEELVTNITNTKALNDKTVYRQENGPMLPETKELLDNFFKPYNEMLADLLHDKKWLFLD